MYKILGGDGKEYGPIPSDTLRQWIAQGRVNAQTQVLAEGAANWQPLCAIPEFAGLSGSAAPAEATSAAPVADGAAHEAAHALANPAGWALMIVGMLGILLSLGLVAFYLIVGIPDSSILQRYLPQQGGGASAVSQKFGAIAGAVFSGLWSVFVVFAGVKLRRLESWGVVMAGAIMASIPCCGGQVLMCVPGLPVGIWVIVVLCQAKVKSAFK